RDLCHGEPRRVASRRQPMRREDDVVQSDERGVCRQGLVLEDIQAGAGDPTLAQRTDQSALLNELAAGDVDQVSRRLHRPELALADQAARSRLKTVVEADEIR